MRNTKVTVIIDDLTLNISKEYSVKLSLNNVLEIPLNCIQVEQLTKEGKIKHETTINRK